MFEALADAPNGALHALREAVMRHPAVQEVGDGLAARGLLVPPHRLRPLRRWGLSPGGGVPFIDLPVSVVLTFVQFAATDPLEISVPFIVKMLPAIVIGAFTGPDVTVSSASRLTKAGQHRAVVPDLLRPCGDPRTSRRHAGTARAAGPGLPGPVGGSGTAERAASAVLVVHRRRHGGGGHRGRRHDGLVRRLRPRRPQLRRVDRVRLRFELRRRVRVRRRRRVELWWRFRLRWFERFQLRWWLQLWGRVLNRPPSLVPNLNRARTQASLTAHRSGSR
ncbi:hypothetical protein SBADM41S_10908 [Streptomyces badius]